MELRSLYWGVNYYKFLSKGHLILFFAIWKSALTFCLFNFLLVVKFFFSLLFARLNWDINLYFACNDDYTWDKILLFLCFTQTTKLQNDFTYVKCYMSKKKRHYLVWGFIFFLFYFYFFYGILCQICRLIRTIIPNSDQQSYGGLCLKWTVSPHLYMVCFSNCLV